MARPARVEQARLNGNTEALSAMGRAGAKKAAQNREMNGIYAEWQGNPAQSVSESEFRAKESGELDIPLETHD